MMMKMFRSDIAKQVSAGSNPPTLVSDCIGQAIRAEYQINQDKEARIQILKAKKENKDATKQLQPRQNLKLHSKGQTSKSARKFKQLGKNKKRKNATRKANKEITLKRKPIEERLEAPEPQTWNYAYTEKDVEAETSSVATVRQAKKGHLIPTDSLGAQQPG
ncbi:hypothetical protein TIFTF001_045181 [Ficus carica]|uniref:Uncharacterized protein n=1 Tax=Ficus carica TaxID=3494 RepID=A0AA88CK07_FICCA|nr:hypothetical protein TIFTF001_045178 [Ficus carica]GMN19385.1 hypothetical protein TIFTF001_045181 [Ficus carica]